MGSMSSDEAKWDIKMNASLTKRLCIDLFQALTFVLILILILLDYK